MPNECVVGDLFRAEQVSFDDLCIEANRTNEPVEREQRSACHGDDTDDTDVKGSTFRGLLPSGEEVDELVHHNALLTTILALKSRLQP